MIKNGALLGRAVRDPHRRLERRARPAGRRLRSRLRHQPVRLRLLHGAGSPAHNRVSRFTANGDVAAAGSEVVILELNNLSGATNHNGGAIHFGPTASSTSRSATTPTGPTRRRWPTGSARSCASTPTAPSRPTTRSSAPATGDNRAIWALGLRNPFTFAFQPGTGPDVHQRRRPEHLGGDQRRHRGRELRLADHRGRRPVEPELPQPALRLPARRRHVPRAARSPAARSTTRADRAVPRRLRRRLLLRRLLRRLDLALSTRRSGAAPAEFATGISAARSTCRSPTTAASTTWRAATGARVPRPEHRQPGAGDHGPARRRQTVTVGQPGDLHRRRLRHGAAHLPVAAQRRRTSRARPRPRYTLASAQLADNGARFRCRVSNTLGTRHQQRGHARPSPRTRRPRRTITQPRGGHPLHRGRHHQLRRHGHRPRGRRPFPPAPSPGRWTSTTTRTPIRSCRRPRGSTSGSFTIPTLGRDGGQRLVPHPPDRAPTRAASPTRSSATSRRGRRTSPCRRARAGLQLLLDGQPLTAPSTFTGVAGIVRSLEAVSPQTARRHDLRVRVVVGRRGARARHLDARPRTRPTPRPSAWSRDPPLTCPASPVPPDGELHDDGERRAARPGTGWRSTRRARPTTHGSEPSSTSRCRGRRRST